MWYFQGEDAITHTYLNGDTEKEIIKEVCLVFQKYDLSLIDMQRIMSVLPIYIRDNCKLEVPAE